MLLREICVLGCGLQKTPTATVSTREFRSALPFEGNAERCLQYEHVDLYYSQTTLIHQFLPDVGMKHFICGYSIELRRLAVYPGP